MCVWKRKKFDAFKDKQDVHQFVRKMYQFLISDHDIQFKYLRSCRGYMIPDKNPTTVVLDPRDDMTPTLIHEILHFVYPDASETWVKRMEPRVHRQLSPQQIRYIETMLLRHMV